MQYLNKEIEKLTKRKRTSALAKKDFSCGVFQNIDNIPKKNRKLKTPSF